MKLIIDSSKRVNLSDNTNYFKINLNPDIILVKKINLLYSDFVINFYNLNQYNNSIIINEGGPDINITLPDIGNYSEAELANYLSIRLNLLGTLIYNVVYNPITMRYTISASANFQLKFLTTNNDIYLLIGFTNNNTIFAMNHTSSLTPDLYPYKYILININEFGLRNRISEQYYTFLVPINVGRNERNIITEQSDFATTINYESIINMPIRTLSIELKDNRGRLIDMNYSNFFLILEILKC